MSGASVTGMWKPNVTHVIASTNERGACNRTRKVLMAILNGKWVLTLECKHPLKTVHLLVVATQFLFIVCALEEFMYYWWGVICKKGLRRITPDIYSWIEELSPHADNTSV